MWRMVARSLASTKMVPEPIAGRSDGMVFPETKGKDSR